MTIFIVFSLLSILWISIIWKYISVEVRKALFWYYMFYFFSNMLGGIIIGLAGEVDYGFYFTFFLDKYINEEYVNQSNILLYWLLLFAPIFILPLVCVKIPYSYKINTKFFSIHTSVGSFAVCSFLVIGIMVFEILRNDNIGILTLSTLNNSKENYAEYIIGRAETFNSMSNRFFGYLYMTLPFFIHIGIYNCFKRNNKKYWIGITGILMGFIILVSIGVNQKAPLAIFFIAVLVGISLIKKLNWQFFILAPLVVLIVVNGLQVYIQGSDGWDVFLSFFHILFRAPAAMPYYVNYFPSQLPYVGVDYGILAQLGLAGDTEDNIIIHTIMWGQTFEKFGVHGSVAAPFNFRAYAQAGLLFSMLNVFLVGLGIRFVGWIYRIKLFGDKAVNHAFFCQSLIVFYFLSQTHIRDCLWSSYGIIWIFHGVLIYYIISKFFYTKKQTINVSNHSIV